MFNVNWLERRVSEENSKNLKTIKLLCPQNPESKIKPIKPSKSHFSFLSLSLSLSFSLSVSSIDISRVRTTTACRLTGESISFVSGGKRSRAGHTRNDTRGDRKRPSGARRNQQRNGFADFSFFKRERASNQRQQPRQPCIDHHCRLLRDRPDERTSRTRRTRRRTRARTNEKNVGLVVRHPSSWSPAPTCINRRTYGAIVRAPDH